jgi:hypothetical protein
MELLPAVTKAVRNVDIESLNIGLVGNPVWRGIWFPAHNLSGPIIL